MTIADAVRHSFDSPSTRPGPTRSGVARAASKLALLSTSPAVPFVYADPRGPAAGHDLNLGISFFGCGFSGLGPKWRVIADIPTALTGVRIEHLLIGPGGVFSVCTDPVSLEHTKFRARRAATLLSGRARFDVEVSPVAALTPAAAGLAREMDGDVLVVAREQLAAHLSELPVVLGRPSIERIYSVGRHLSTWQPKTVAWTDF